MAASFHALIGLALVAACTVIYLKLFSWSTQLRLPSLLSSSTSDTKIALKLIQEIPLADLPGRLDHFGFDASRNLIFLSCLGDNSVLVVDSFAGVVLERLRHKDLARPQGLLYVEQGSRLYVANAATGKVCIFEGNVDNPSEWTYLQTVEFEGEADNLRYDSRLGQVLVGYGEGAIGAISVQSNERLDLNLECVAHPESFQFTDEFVFVNVADAGLIQVFDRASGDSRTWALPEGYSKNFPMCLDADNMLLYVVTRRPASVTVYDAATGSRLETIECVGDSDDIFLDEARQLIYVVGGVGNVSVIHRERVGDGQFLHKVVATASSAIGARTGLWYTSRDHLYVVRYLDHHTEYCAVTLIVTKVRLW
jgi:hypothetical protein